MIINNLRYCLIKTTTTKRDLHSCCKTKGEVGEKVSGMKSMIAKLKALEKIVEELSQDVEQKTKYKRKGKIRN